MSQSFPRRVPGPPAPQFARKSRILVTCPKGIPPYLRQELTALGFPILSEAAAAVETEGTLDDTMRLNLYLRTAHRVHYLLRNFRAATPDDLYIELLSVPWEEYIDADGYVSATSSVLTDSIVDTRFANVKCKDAIVDRIREKRGRRPDSGPDRTKTVVYLFWRGDRGSVYLDTSGEALSKRNYRKMPFKAPMQETLAAAVVMATGWNGRGNFVNPMCGSGTLAIEAALIALNRAPGYLRDNFGFMHIMGFDKKRWFALHDEAKTQSRKSLEGRIIASDIDAEAIKAARQNARTAGVEHLISLGVCDFAETPVPVGDGVILLNPEYGERLGVTEQLKATYERIGDFFKQKCAGYRGFVFTGNAGLAKVVGLHPSRRLQFFNSEIECRLLEYELYAGTRGSGKPHA